MTKEEVIIECCSILAMVYRSIGDFTEPSDGFCSKCAVHLPKDWDFKHSGRTIEYTRKAVLRQLKEDGYGISPNWNKNTGKEVGK